MINILSPPGGKVLFFGHHKTLLQAAEAGLRAAGVDFARITGDVAANARQAQVGKFQAASGGCRAALLSIKVCACLRPRNIRARCATRVHWFDQIPSFHCVPPTPATDPHLTRSVPVVQLFLDSIQLSDPAF